MRDQGWLRRILVICAILVAMAMYPLLAIDAGGLRGGGVAGVLLVAAAMYVGLVLLLILGWLKLRILREMPADPVHPYRGIWRRSR